MNKAKPISPNEIADAKVKYFPDFVIESVNSLIASKYTDGSARVLQKDIVTEIVTRGNIERCKVFENGYLNFEEIYEAAGWTVSYDKPGYNESYDANFTFKKKKQ